MVYREYKRAKKKRNKTPIYCEKTEREKEVENEIAIERERSRRTPGGDPFSGGWL